MNIKMYIYKRKEQKPQEFLPDQSLMQNHKLLGDIQGRRLKELLTLCI